MPSIVKPAQRREAVIRILSGQSTTAQEAARFKVDQRQPERWVADAKKRNPSLQAAAPPAPSAAPAAAPSAPSPVVGPSAPPPSPMLEDAKKAAGLVPVHPITPGEVDEATRKALEEDKRFCVQTINDLKTQALSMVATARLGFPKDDPQVLALGPLGPTAEGVVKVNATILAPHLRRLMAGWLPLAIALSMDFVNSISGLAQLAEQRGMKPRQPAKPGAPPPRPPIFKTVIDMPGAEQATEVPHGQAAGQILDAPPAEDVA